MEKLWWWQIYEIKQKKAICTTSKHKIFCSSVPISEFNARNQEI